MYWILKYLFFLICFYSINCQFPFGSNFPFGPNNSPFGMMDNMMSGLQNSMKQLNHEMHELQLETAVLGGVSGMVVGTGGSSKLTYNGKSVLNINGRLYNCNDGGTITVNVKDGVKCVNGKLTPAEFDVCRPGGKSVMQSNQYYCIYDNRKSGSRSMSNINGNVECNGGEIYTIETLNKKCGSDAATTNLYALVEYVADNNNPNRINYQANPYLPCDQHAPICTFYTDFSGLEGTKAAP